MHLLFYMVIFLAGCSVLNRNPPSKSISTPPAESGVEMNSQVSGVVQLGPVQGAKVEVFLIIFPGQKGQKLFETFTNALGEYTLTLPSGTEHVLIISTGGTYLDEADQQEKTAPELSNLVDASLNPTASLSPISSLLTKRALSLIEDQALSISHARELAREEVATLFGLSEEEVDVLPSNPFDPNTSSNANAASLKKSLALASFSHFIKDNHSESLLSDILRGMEEDFVTNGKLDEPNRSTLAGEIAEQWAQKMSDAKANALLNEALIFKNLPSSQGLADSMIFHPNTQNTQPGAPTSVSGTTGDAQVALTWTAPSSNGGASITDYVIQFSSDSGSSWTTFSDGTSTLTSATVTGLANGTAYIFKVAATNSVGTGSYSSNGASVIPVAPNAGPTACHSDCYTGAQDLAIGTERLGPDSSTLTLQYANGTDGFKIWREKDGTRILNATGLIEHGWQKQLTRAGTGFSATDFTTGSDIAGRVCPTHVFLSHSSMTAENRCLYYDGGNAAQALDAAGTSGTESEDWLQSWYRADTGRGTDSSYYEGNIKTCADKGMRLPVMYETTMPEPSGVLPTGDTGVSPTWAGSTNGVPSHTDYTWTASASTNGPPLCTACDYSLWSGTTVISSGFYDPSRLARCVLPSHGDTHEPPPPPPPPPGGGIDSECESTCEPSQRCVDGECVPRPECGYSASISPNEDGTCPPTWPGSDGFETYTVLSPEGMCIQPEPVAYYAPGGQCGPVGCYEPDPENICSTEPTQLCETEEDCGWDQGSDMKCCAGTCKLAVSGWVNLNYSSAEECHAADPPGSPASCDAPYCPL